MGPTEYTSYDGLELGALASRGEVRPSELARLAIAGIEQVDARLNAVLEVFDDRVSALDDTPAHGPFFGVPLFLKDLGSGMVGRLQEMGLPLLQGHRVTEEHLLTRNFLDAGFNVLGRTAIPPLAYAVDTHSPLHGITRNPWDPERSPGGSSGGAAAIVAARVTPVAHASDGAGSTRIPAAWCGLVGLKPTRGRLPMPGVNELGIYTGTEGVVTRTVRDTAAALDWMAHSAPGYSAIPIRRPDGSYLDAIEQPPRPLRIALSTGSWGRATPPDAEIVGRVTAAAEVLEELGHRVEPVPDDAIGDFGLFWNTFTLGLGWAGGLTIAKEAEALGMPADASTLSPVLADLARWSATIPAAEVSERLKRNQRHSLDLARLFERYDVLVTPTTSQGPPVAGGPLSLMSDEDAESWTERLWDAVRYTPLGNETGIPGITVPIEPADAGLPIGMQLYGPWCAEDLLLRLARQLEAAQPHWFDVRPPISFGGPNEEGS